MSPRRAGHRHRLDDPPVSGTLPLPQPRESRLAFPPDRGSLPQPAVPPRSEPRSEPPTEPTITPAEQAACRTRVRMPTVRAQRPPSDDGDTGGDEARVYQVPPSGLGGLAIGSVPASVTPPKSWRRAAWFATGASGLVVVGLLFAGTFLVGKPDAGSTAQGGWPGFQGVAPAITEDLSGGMPPGEHEGSGAATHTARRPDRAAGQAVPGAGAGTRDDATPSGQGGQPGGPVTTGTAAPSGPPEKPPITPAPRETPVKPPWWYSFPPDAQTMGDNSEKFFNTVTTDPNQAASVTTGQLHDQGPQALAARYAGIAYFEVKKISIDQQRGVTVNTVEVTHTDGTKTIEQRTLTFGDGDKIADDGR